MKNRSLNSYKSSRYFLKSEHLDAGESLFFARELEHILSEAFNAKYAQLKATQMIPVDMSVPAEDEQVTWREYDSFAKARASQDMGEDVPMVNVSGKENSQRMQQYDLGYFYTLDELKKAAKYSKPLERDRAQTTQKGLAQKLDDVAAAGDSNYSLTGLLNLANTNTGTASTKAGGGLTWAVATADEIINDLVIGYKKIVVDSKEIERPTRIILPTAQYEVINGKPRSVNSDTTVRKFWDDTHPDCPIVSWERAAGAGSGGTDRAVFYDPTPMNLRLLVSVMFEALPPQQKNWAFKVPCRMKTGGVICPYPKSVLYMDGI